MTLKEELDNLNKLFSDDQKILYEGIKEKSDWILRKFVYPIKLVKEPDETGHFHYFNLEEIYNKNVIFDKAVYMGKFDGIPDDEIQKTLQNLNIFTFLTKINLEDDYDIYVDFDLSKLSKEDYLKLFTNVYYAHKESDLKIDFYDLENPINLIKICMIGRENEVKIVLDDDKLNDGRLYLPYIDNIYVARKIPDDLLKDLYIFTKANNIELSIIYETQGN